MNGAFPECRHLYDGLVLYFHTLRITFHVNLDKFHRVHCANYFLFKKVKSLIKLWKRIYLTPFGKITVIKSLLLPPLNHLFSVNLSDKLMNLVNEVNAASQTTQSNRVSDFRDFVCPLFPKAILFDFYSL